MTENNFQEQLSKKARHAKRRQYTTLKSESFQVTTLTDLFVLSKLITRMTKDMDARKKYLSKQSNRFIFSQNSNSLMRLCEFTNKRLNLNKLDDEQKPSHPSMLYLSMPDGIMGYPFTRVDFAALLYQNSVYLPPQLINILVSYMSGPFIGDSINCSDYDTGGTKSIILQERKKPAQYLLNQYKCKHPQFGMSLITPCCGKLLCHLCFLVEIESQSQSRLCPREQLTGKRQFAHLKCNRCHEPYIWFDVDNSYFDSNDDNSLCCYPSYDSDF